MTHYLHKVTIWILALTLIGITQVKAFNYDETSCKDNNYIEAWGKLKVVGNQLCSESGTPVQLRGWCTHGYQWSGRCCYDDQNDFAGMKGFGANVARITMYVTEGGSVNPEWIKNCMDWTNNLGMYCIVDWQVITPGTPTSYEQYQPAEFFASMAEYAKAKGYKHVMYEICGEPNDNNVPGNYNPTLWADIKTYAASVLPAIANEDPDAVVIVGTPQYCKDLVSPMEDPLNTYGLQVMYSFHYSACDDSQYLGNLQIAAASLPLFVSEWVTTGFTDQYVLCTDWSDSLLNVCSGVNLGNQLISWCNWSFSTEGNESRSLNMADNYITTNLSQSGHYVVNKLRKGDVTNTKTSSTPYQGNAILVSSTEATVISVEEYDEGGEGVAYHEYETSNECNTGDNSPRHFECVDLSYTDESRTSSYIHNIAEGEWISFTLNVEKTGYYKVSLITDTSHSFNEVSFIVNQKNAIRDFKDTTKNIWSAVKIHPYEGVDIMGESYLTSNKNANQHDFCIYFEQSGIQTLNIGFMTDCGVLGNITLLPKQTFNTEDTTSTGDNTSIGFVTLNNEVNIYPNPTSDGSFTIQVADASQVQVYDLQGKLCYSTIVNHKSKVNTGLGTGMYMVKITSDKQTITKKLIIR